MRRSFVILTALAVAALVSSPLSSLAGETVRVGIDRNLFQPKVLKVKPGTTVEWVNDEKRTSHSVFFEQEGREESDRLFSGESWKRSFDKPGTYPYRCGPHPDMVGVIEVAP
ncbi:Plastocyanin [Candidatus Terasakiella magnetica]|nr:Plastocyanin [Candidatus Terasakiella magnetica]